MKSVLIALALCLSVPTFAATNPDGGATQAVSTDDATKIRDGVKALGQAFGVQPPAPAQTQAPAQPAPQKSMTDIADKALDMFGGLVANISNTLEKIAPHVWRIMVRQQYAKAIADTTVPFLLLLMAIIYPFVFRKVWKRPEPFYYQGQQTDEATTWIVFGTALPLIFGIAMTIWLANAFADSAKYIFNPEYYAVKDILTMILNPGSMQ